MELFASSLLAVQLMLSGAAQAPATQPNAAASPAIQAIEQAVDPSRAVAAYAKALADEPASSIAIERTYTPRMID